REPPRHRSRGDGGAALLSLSPPPGAAGAQAGGLARAPRQHEPHGQGRDQRQGGDARPSADDQGLFAFGRCRRRRRRPRPRGQYRRRVRLCRRASRNGEVFPPLHARLSGGSGVMIYNAPVRSFVRLSLYVAWILAMIPVQAVTLLLRLKLAERLPVIVHRVVIRILDARVMVKGEQCKEGAVLFVSNHASYADISIIGAHIRGCFVAKAEVAKWPLFGICAKLSRTVFVDRRARYARAQAEEMKRRFAKGDRLILFAEGTSSDGNRVLPFRSSLFATA